MTRTLITGASAGLGLELARLFASDGRSLILVARSGDRLRALAAALRKDFEVEAHCVALDLTEPEAVPALMANLQAENLKVEVLVNNAGFGAYGPFEERQWDVYGRMIDLNIRALSELTHALLPQIGEAARSFPERVCGVMNVASTAAFQPGPLMAAYFASKAFVLSFSEALHEEQKKHGVAVSTFCPGPTKTEFFKTGDMIPTGDISEADLAEYNRRDAKRMDAGQAARIGYHGFLQRRAIVIPGKRNAFQAWLAPRVPRGLVRRITHKMLTK